jgi:hypothetical protein
MSDSQEISSTTQKFLDIFDITNDVIVLRDGTVSTILLISAMNFGLLAEPEQDAIIYSYAALLNSLNFPVQIVINSKTKDATAYLQLLESQLQRITSEKKRSMIKRYQNFVGQLIKERNVLDKKFYVIIPAQPIEVGMVTAQSVLPGGQVPQITQEQKAAVVEKAIGILEPRRDHLIAQFNRIGLYARPLVTQEIIEIFYNNYNPEAYEGQQITDTRNYTTAVVNASTAAAPSLDQLRQEIATKNQMEALAGIAEKPGAEDQSLPPLVEQAPPAQPLVQAPAPSLTPQPTQTPAQTPESSPLPPVAEL